MTATMFRVPGPIGQPTLARVLDGAFTVIEEAVLAVDTAYLDTFDWRLFNRSASLLYSGDTLTLALLNTDKKKVQVIGGQRPVFAWDLPSGAIRKQVAGALEMRALLVRAQTHTLTTAYRVLNDNDETICQLAVDAISHGLDGDAVGIFVRLLPARGYDRELAEIGHRLTETGATELAAGELFDVVMQATGQQPGGYQPKPVVPLDPAMHADKALKALLRAELEVIQINEPYISQDIDTEFLHDYRVALRRTRSALAEMKGVFSARTTKQLRVDLQVANQFSNELRDLDVYILSEDRFRSLLPGQLRDGIAPLFDHLRGRRAVALASLIEALESPVYRRTMADLTRFLDEPVAADAAAPAGKLPVLQVANRRIYKQYRQVLKAGRTITVESPDEMLHALRIQCKRLRYLMELFAGLYASREITGLIKQLRTLQGMLGDFNDLSVQEAYLMRTATEMAGSGQTPPDTLMAIGALVSAMDAERTVVRASFGDTFKAFAARDNRQRFKLAFDGRGTKL